MAADAILEPDEELVIVGSQVDYGMVVTDRRVFLVRKGYAAKLEGAQSIVTYPEIKRVNIEPAGLMISIELMLHDGSYVGMSYPSTSEAPVRRMSELIEETAVATGASQGWTRTRLPSALGDLIEASLTDGERIIREHPGQTRPVAQVLVITDRRVMLARIGLGAKNVKSYQYDEISRVEVITSLTAVRIRFAVAGTDPTTLLKILLDNAFDLPAHQEYEARELAKLIEEQIQNARSPRPATTSPPVTASVADELAKLASLRDAGVVTPDEFDRLKARLLS